MYHWLPFTAAVLCPTIVWECNYFFFKSCQDTVLDFILYQSICGLGLSSPILQCQNLGERGVKSLHPFQSLSLPYHQLSASLTRPSLSKYFSLLELLWILPSLSADASALKSASGFPDTSQFSVCPAKRLHVIFLSLLYPAPVLQRCETEKMQIPPATLPPSSTHLLQWQWLCREIPRWSILRAFLRWDRCWRDWRCLMPSDVKTNWNSQKDWKTGDTFQDTESSKCLNPHRVSVYIYSFDPRCCTWK